MVQVERKGQIKEKLMRYNSQERVWGDSPHQYQVCGRVSRYGEEPTSGPIGLEMPVGLACEDIQEGWKGQGLSPRLG